MMKAYKNVLIGFFAGIALLGITGWSIAPDLMLRELQSPYDLDKTVEIIKNNALSQGWVVPSVTPLHKSIAKHTGNTIPPVYLVNICHPDYAYEILKADRSRIVSVFMPCTISVYEKSDGRVFVGTMNAGLLGRMFGGNVAAIMGDKVSVDQQKFIALK